MPKDNFDEGFSNQRTQEIQYQQFHHRSENDTELHACWGYRRSTDFDPQDKPGQDFTALRLGGGSVVGVLADGVSQSFFGDIGARIVSEHLLGFLWERRGHPPGEKEVAGFLQELAAKFEGEIQLHPLPDTINPLLREALERTRSAGTQAVFSAFIFGGAQGALNIYQVGDTVAWIHGEDGTRTLVQACDPRGRWSSSGCSRLSLQHQAHSKVAGIVVHSDGAREEWGKSLAETDVSLEAFVCEAEERAGVDDVSFIAAGSRKVRKPAAILEPAAPSRWRRVASIAAILVAGLAAGIFIGRFALPPFDSEGGSLADGASESHDDGSKDSAAASVQDDQPEGVSAGIAASVLPRFQETTQKEFKKKFGRHLFAIETTGYAVAHIAVRGVEFQMLEIIGPDKTSHRPKPFKEDSNASHQEFFVKIGGFEQGNKNKVEIRLLTGNGDILSIPDLDDLELRGCQDDPWSGESDPFYGYHEIDISATKPN